MNIFEQVNEVCNLFDLHRLSGEDVHPSAWLNEKVGLGVAISGIGLSASGIHVQEIDGDTESDALQLADINPRAPYAMVLLERVLLTAIHELDKRKK